MTRRQEMEQRLGTLNDLKSILTAMRNLALVEMRKLARLRANHERVVQTLTRAAEDFLAHHPHLAPPAAAGPGLLIVVGSERGFCGNFNELVRDEAERHLAGQPAPAMLPIGSKLISRMERDARLVAQLGGPSVAEEVPAVLARALATIDEHQQRHPGAGLNLWAAYHDMDAGAVRIDEITAVRPRADREPEFPFPPVLTLPPAKFLVELIEHHLFALLTRVFYSSLMAENRMRLAHMENATRRLENKTEEMTRRWNLLRQEEVTQEIEIIMLSTLAGNPSGRL